jgi:prefoldin subunit 5
VISNNPPAIIDELNDSIRKLANPTGGKTALVVNGESLNVIFSDEQLKRLFVQIGENVNVVLACRVSPK